MILCPPVKQKRVKVGIVGYGYWGPKLARNFHELSESELVAICDIKEDCLNPTKLPSKVPLVTQKFEDLLKSDLDAIAIATPAITHFQLAKMALLSGKHILIEKPIATTSQEAQELIYLANSQNLVLMVGHTFEYDPAIKV